MALSFNGVRYYYVTSLQGDVIAIVDQNGTVVTTYLYDAWGNHLHTTGSLSATVGRYNPLRYRGYVYDRETNLYYLQSRYYNPETGRFINGDGFTATGQGIIGNNMFAYCGNNPVNYVDPSGQGWLTALKSIVKAFVRVIVDYVSISSNEALKQKQQDHNAELVYNYLSFNGWSHNSICAVLGNMAVESYLNPGKSQDGGGGGFGLVQWDPASRYLDWAKVNGYSANSLVGQMEFLMFDIKPKEQSTWFDRKYINSSYAGYYMSSSAFIISNQSVEYLTQVFLHSYERAGVSHLDRRLRAANYYDQYFR